MADILNPNLGSSDFESRLNRSYYTKPFISPNIGTDYDIYGSDDDRYLRPSTTTPDSYIPDNTTRTQNEDIVPENPSLDDSKKSLESFLTKSIDEILNGAEAGSRDLFSPDELTIAQSRKDQGLPLNLTKVQKPDGYGFIDRVQDQIRSFLGMHDMTEMNTIQGQFYYDMVPKKDNYTDMLDYYKALKSGDDGSASVDTMQRLAAHRKALLESYQDDIRSENRKSQNISDYGLWGSVIASGYLGSKVGTGMGAAGGALAGGVGAVPGSAIGYGLGWIIGAISGFAAYKGAKGISDYLTDQSSKTSEEGIAQESMRRLMEFEGQDIDKKIADTEKNLENINKKIEKNRERLENVRENYKTRSLSDSWYGGLPSEYYQQKEAEAEAKLWGKGSGDFWLYNVPGTLGSTASLMWFQINGILASWGLSKIAKGAGKFGPKLGMGGHAVRAVTGLTSSLALFSNAYFNYQSRLNETFGELYDTVVEKNANQAAEESSGVVDANGKELSQYDYIVAEARQLYESDKEGFSKIFFKGEPNDMDLFKLAMDSDLPSSNEYFKKLRKEHKNDLDNNYYRQMALSTVDIAQDFILFPYLRPLLKASVSGKLAQAGAKVANTTAGKAATKVGKTFADNGAKAVDAIVDYGVKIAPKAAKSVALASAKVIAKNVVKMGVKVGADMAMEGVADEGNQYMIAQDYLNGISHDNPNWMTGFFDDIKYAWQGGLALMGIGSSDPGSIMYSAVVGDKEWMESVISGAAVSAVMGGSTAVASHVGVGGPFRAEGNIIDQIKANKFVREAAVQQFANKEDLTKAYIYADKRATNRPAEIISALENVRKTKPDYVTDEDLDNEIARVKRVMNLASSPVITDLAKELGYDRNSNDFTTLVALANFSTEKSKEARNQLDEISNSEAISKLTEEVDTRITDLIDKRFIFGNKTDEEIAKIKESEEYNNTKKNALYAFNNAVEVRAMTDLVENLTKNKDKAEWLKSKVGNWINPDVIQKYIDNVNKQLDSAIAEAEKVEKDYIDRQIEGGVEPDDVIAFSSWVPTEKQMGDGFYGDHIKKFQGRLTAAIAASDAMVNEAMMNGFYGGKPFSRLNKEDKATMSKHIQKYVDMFKTTVANQESMENVLNEDMLEEEHDIQPPSTKDVPDTINDTQSGSGIVTPVQEDNANLVPPSASEGQQAAPQEVPEDFLSPDIDEMFADAANVEPVKNSPFLSQDHVNALDDAARGMSGEQPKQPTQPKPEKTPEEVKEDTKDKSKVDEGVDNSTENSLQGLASLDSAEKNDILEELPAETIPNTGNINKDRGLVSNTFFYRPDSNIAPTSTIPGEVFEPGSELSKILSEPGAKDRLQFDIRLNRNDNGKYSEWTSDTSEDDTVVLLVATDPDTGKKYAMFMRTPKDANAWYNTRIASRLDSFDRNNDGSQGEEDRNNVNIEANQEKIRDVHNLREFRSNIISKYAEARKIGGKVVPVVSLSNGYFNANREFDSENRSVSVNRSILDVKGFGITNIVEDMNEDKVIFGIGKGAKDEFNIFDKFGDKLKGRGGSGVLFIYPKTPSGLETPVQINPRRFEHDPSVVDYIFELVVNLRGSQAEFAPAIVNGKKVKSSLTAREALAIIVNFGDHTLLKSEDAERFPFLSRKQFTYHTTSDSIQIGDKFYNRSDLLSNEVLAAEFKQEIINNDFHWNIDKDLIWNGLRNTSKYAGAAKTSGAPTYMNFLTFYNANETDNMVLVPGVLEISIEDAGIDRSPRSNKRFVSGYGQGIPWIAWYAKSGLIESDLHDQIFADPFVYANEVRIEEPVIKETPKVEAEQTVPVAAQKVATPLINSKDGSRISDSRLNDIFGKIDDIIASFSNKDGTPLSKSTADEAAGYVMMSIDDNFPDIVIGDRAAFTRMISGRLSGENTEVISEIHVIPVGSEAPVQTKKTYTVDDLSNMSIEEISAAMASGDIELDSDSEVDDVNEIIGAPKTFREEDVVKQPINVSEAKSNLNKMLGLTDEDIEITDKLIEIGHSKTAAGLMRKDAILLWEGAPVGTEYHEAFHRVELLILDNVERNKVYDAYRKQVNSDNMPDMIVSEMLADGFRDFQAMPMKKIGYRIKKAYNKIMKLIGAARLMTDTMINDLYSDILRGAYKGVAYDIASVRRFEALYGESGGAPYTWSTPNGKVELRHFQTPSDVYETINSMKQYLFATMDINNIDDVGSLANSKTKLIESIIKFGSGNSVTKEQRDALSELLRHYNDIFWPELVKELNRMSIREVNAKEDSRQSDVDAGDVKSGEITWGDKSSLEMSKKDNARLGAKLIIGTMPLTDKVKVSNPDGTTSVRFQVVKSSITGLPLGVDFDSSFNKTLDALYRFNTKDKLMAGLAGLSHDPFFITLYNRLNNKRISENTFTQFLLTVSSYKHQPKHMTMGKDVIEGTDKTGSSFRITDSHTIRARKIYPLYWNQAFYHKTGLVSIIRKNGEKAKVEVDSTALNRIIAEFDTLVSDVVNAKANGTLKANADGFKQTFANILGKIGIDSDVDTIDNLLSNIQGYEKNDHDDRLWLYLTNIRPYSIGNFFKNRLKAVANGEKLVIKRNNVDIPVGIDEFIATETAVKNLASAYGLTHPRPDEASVYGPEGNPMYPMSQHNYLSNIVDRINESNAKDSFVDMMSNIAYNGNSLILASARGRNKISLNTINSIAEEGTGDTGRNYISISDAEDYAMKMTVASDGYVLFPTMADRGIYNTVSGVQDLPYGKDIKYRLTVDGNTLKINESALITIDGYANDEWEAIKEYYSAEHRDALENDPSKIVKNYHTKGRGGRFRYFTSILSQVDGVMESVNLSDLLDKLEESSNGSPAVMLENLKYIDEAYFGKTPAERYNIVNELIKARVNEEIETATGLGLISTIYSTDQITGERLPGIPHMVNMNLDEVRYNKLVNHYSTHANQHIRFNPHRYAVYDMIAEYTVATIVSTNEFNKVFSKDPAFYGSTDDMIKRYSMLLSTGDNLRTEIGRESYSTAVLKDNIISDSQYDVLFEIFRADELEKLGRKEPGLSKTEKDKRSRTSAGKRAAGYTIENDGKGVNQTDASVYISPQMYKDILKMSGKLTDKVRLAFNVIEGGTDWAENPSLYADAIETIMNPLKMTSVNDIFDKELGLDIPVGDKMALFPLFKTLAVGDNAELYNRMTSQGKYVGLPKIDMIKTESAQKMGHNVVDKFYTDSSNNTISDLTNLTIRPQKFENLRTQLNTDPHDAERQLFGTQPAKIALSNVEKTLVYENGMTGQQILDEVFGSMNAISNLGKLRFQNKLGNIDADGSFETNVDKVSKFLYDNAEAAGMSSEVVQGLTVTDGSISIPISAMSEAGWIESSIISSINKETIDINMPGGAFIQMSSFGFKSISKLSDKIYNKGDRLKIFRESDKTMEAMVSVNLFKHIIPKKYRETYKSQRKWLVDNNIIGPGSNAVMGYRIPTQGNNSTSALTIVDILPETIADTIILPDSFTSLTGSDFDIDKLYVVRHNYKDGKKVEFDETIPVPDGDDLSKLLGYGYSEEYVSKLAQLNNSRKLTKWDVNTREANENRLLDMYLAVLTDKSKLAETRQPLDMPTSYLKDEVMSNIDGRSKKAPPSAFAEASPTFQLNKKSEYTEGVNGIAAFALNTTNHALTQMTGLSFKGNPILASFGIGSLSGVDSIDGTGISIMDWLSTMINAHVDVAKDPYIIRANVNAWTYNMTNLLLRSGIGERTFYFLSQRILKDMATAVKNTKGRLGIDNTKSRSSLENKAINDVYDKYEKMAKSLAMTDEQRTMLEDLNDRDEDGKRIVSNRHAINDTSKQSSKEYLLKQLADGRNNVKTFDYYYNQLLIYGAFQDLTPFASGLNELIQSTQIDTKKFGNNFLAQNYYLTRIKNNVLNNKVFDSNAVGRFYTKSFLDTKILNSIIFGRAIFSDYILKATDAFSNVHNNLLSILGYRDSISTDIINSTARGVEAALKSEFFNNKLADDNVDPRSFFYDNHETGTKSMATRFSELTAAIKNGAYPEMIDASNRIKNDLLNHLLPKPGIEEYDGYNSPDYLTTNTLTDKDTHLNDKLKIYWQELLDSKHEDVRKFGEDLVMYAFLASGDNPSMHNIFKLVPLEYRKKIGYVDHMNSVMRRSEDSDLSINYYDVIRNNWNNGRLVPDIKLSYKIGEKTMFLPRILSKDFIPGTNERYPMLIVDVNAYSIGTNIGNDLLFKPFVKYNSAKDNNPSTTILYKHVGNSVIEESGVEKIVPIYMAVPKKGLKSKGIVITEYDGKHNSLYDFNNLPGNKILRLNNHPETIQSFINDGYYNTGLDLKSANIILGSAKFISDFSPISEANSYTYDDVMSGAAYSDMIGARYGIMESKIDGLDSTQDSLVEDTVDNSEVDSLLDSYYSFTGGFNTFAVGDFEDFARENGISVNNQLRAKYGKKLMDMNSDSARDKAWREGVENGHITEEDGEWYVNGLNPNSGGKGGHVYAFKQYYKTRYDYGENLLRKNGPIISSTKVKQIDPVFNKKVSIELQPDNIERILDGSKTTTIRSDRQAEAIGLKPGETGTVDIGGELFNVINEGSLTIDEAGGKEAIIASEGIESEDQFKFKQSKDWANGKGKLNIYRFSRVQSKDTNKNGSVNPLKFIMHSGGAIGSDTAWEQIGKEFGLTRFNQYYHGKKTPTGNVEITQEQYDEGVVAVNKANKKLHRQPSRYMSLLARNWQQVKNADAVFAIGEINNDGVTVSGGTGWAVQMAVDSNKPVYVFSQTDNLWYEYDYLEGFIRTATPTLTENFAGIGTRGITESGKRAIRDVYEKTFSKQVDQAATSGKVTMVSEFGGYTKNTAPDNPYTSFMFTENLQAHLAASAQVTGANELASVPELPRQNKPVKLNVTVTNNQAGIRTKTDGTINPNAFGIIVKKYQQGENSESFVKAEGQFNDNDRDFKLFKEHNENSFYNAKKYEAFDGGGLVFPDEIATGKSALPIRFAEWMKDELLSRFGLNYYIVENKTPGYSGYGLVISKEVATAAAVESPENRIFLDENGDPIKLYRGYSMEADVEASDILETLPKDGQRMATDYVVPGIHFSTDKTAARGYGEIKADRLDVMGKPSRHFRGDFVKVSEFNITGNNVYRFKDAREAEKAITNGEINDWDVIILEKDSTPFSSGMEYIVRDASQVSSPIAQQLEPIYFNSRTPGFDSFSNFSNHKVVIDGIVYNNSEAAYQAGKTDDEFTKKLIGSHITGFQAKSAGSRVLARPDWESVKSEHMLEVLRAKFSQNEDAKQLLLSTGESELIHDTSDSTIFRRNDNYWGNGHEGTGKNMMGKLLTQVRSELRDQQSTYQVTSDVTSQPVYPESGGLIDSKANEKYTPSENVITIAGRTINLSELGIPFSLNDSQIEALEGIAGWLDGTSPYDSPAYTLQGAAGTGKSTVTRIIHDIVKGEFDNFMPMAPTHMAKSVLSNMLGDDMEVSTIHKFLGLRPNVDIATFDMKSLQFTEFGATPIGSNNFIIVDEASMVNNALVDALVDRARSLSSRILFIGDRHQLNPVNQSNISKMFTEGYPSSILGTVERQKSGNPLLSKLVEMRDIMDSNPNSYPSIKEDFTEYGKGLVIADTRNIDDQIRMMKFFIDKISSDEFKSNTNIIRWLAYKNSTVKSLNTIIRHSMGRTDNIVVDELLRAYNHYGDHIQNSDEVVVRAVDENVKVEKISSSDTNVIATEVTLSRDYSQSLNDINYDLGKPVKSQSGNNQKVKLIVNTDEVAKFKDNLTRYYQFMEDQLDSLFQSYIDDQIDRRGYFREMFKMQESRVAKISGYAVMDDISTDINKSRYIGSGGAVRKTASTTLIKKTFDYGYAGTTHKSQGNTYKYTIVNYSDLMLMRDSAERLRAIYTATSRSTDATIMQANQSADEGRAFKDYLKSLDEIKENYDTDAAKFCRGK